MNERINGQGFSPAFAGPVGNWSYGGAPVGGVVAGAVAPAPVAFAAAGGYGTFAAPTNYAPTQTNAPIVHPTQHSVNRNVFRHVVPHIHPSHNHTVNEHLYQHQHYVTNTCSTSHRCCSQHVFCGPLPSRPCGWC